MWRVNENPNPCTDLDETLHAHPHLFRKGFAAGLTPSPPPPWPRGPETLRAEGHIFTKQKMLDQQVAN